MMMSILSGILSSSLLSLCLSLYPSYLSTLVEYLPPVAYIPRNYFTYLPLPPSPAR